MNKEARAPAGSARGRRLRVDREQTCPMLIKMYCCEDGFHSVSCFDAPDMLPVDDEVIIYGWKDTTLKELANMIKEIHLDSRRMESRFIFRIINVDSRGVLRVRELGMVHNAPGRRSFTRQDPPQPSLDTVADEDRTLDDGRFIQGDYIDVAIFCPQR